MTACVKIDELKQELQMAQEMGYVIFCSHKHHKTKHTIFIQFSSHVCNAKIDRLIRYIELFYKFGISNRDFQHKTITAVYLDAAPEADVARNTCPL